MTKLIAIFGMILILAHPLYAGARVAQTRIDKTFFQDIPSQFATSSETSRMEWGCPVSEIVKANSKAEALGKIEGECKAQVRRAAAGKPEVLDVIQTSVIWPDINVTEADGGFYLNGTFFLETLVLHRIQGK